MRDVKNKLLSIITPEKLKQELIDIGSATKIAKKYKINPVTVYSAFKLCDIDCIIKPKRNDLTRELLEKSYAEIGNLKGVARKLNADSGTIKRYMQEFGLVFAPQIRYMCNDDFFSRDNEESFYVAGFIAADGCVKDRCGKSGNRIYEMQIGLSTKDRDHLIKLRDAMGANHRIHDFFIKVNKQKHPTWNDTNRSEFTIVSKTICEDLTRFNIVPRKSLTYTFPEWLRDHPLCHHFIRGYNDGDGSFYKPKLQPNKVEQIYFAMRGTSTFLKSVRDILEKKCYLETRTTPISISSNCGTLEYGGNDVIFNIANYLYKDATIFLDRKYNIVKKLFF